VLADHIVDAVIVQQLALQQPRTAGADDRDLRAVILRVPSLSKAAFVSSEACRNEIPSSRPAAMNVSSMRCGPAPARGNL